MRLPPSYIEQPKRDAIRTTWTKSKSY